MTRMFERATTSRLFEHDIDARRSPGSLLQAVGAVPVYPPSQVARLAIRRPRKRPNRDASRENAPMPRELSEAIRADTQPVGPLWDAVDDILELAPDMHALAWHGLHLLAARRLRAQGRAV